jgi:CBS domain-containing protein
MSPRAACRLETLGFEQVYDYVPGKSDWLAHGLPTAGTAAKRPRAGALARDDVVTCGLDDAVGEVRSRVEESRYGFALVTSERGTLLGRLRISAMGGADAGAIAQSVMEPGPSTVRADVEASELAARLAKRELGSAIVTTPEGRLLGVVRRADLEGQARDG